MRRVPGEGFEFRVQVVGPVFVEARHLGGEVESLRPRLVVEVSGEAFLHPARSAVFQREVEGVASLDVERTECFASGRDRDAQVHRPQRLPDLRRAGHEGDTFGQEAADDPLDGWELNLLEFGGSDPHLPGR